MAINLEKYLEECCIQDKIITDICQSLIRVRYRMGATTYSKAIAEIKTLFYKEESASHIFKVKLACYGLANLCKYVEGNFEDFKSKWKDSILLLKGLYLTNRPF